jgi:hypothetical protein
MLRVAVLALFFSATAAQAATIECDELDWGVREAKLAELIQQRALDGWVLLSFAKAGTACFTQGAPAQWECRDVKWKNATDLGVLLEELRTYGFEPVAFPKPGTVCGRRTGGTPQIPRRAESPKAAPAPAPAAEPAPAPAPAPKAKGTAPTGDVRERAARLHAELKALEEKYEAGEIGRDEYEKKKRELEGQ